MTFPFNVYLAAVVSAFITALLSLPLWRRWCLRTGLVDDPGRRKIHDHPVPLAGGLAVMTGIVVPTLAACLALWWHGMDGKPGADAARATLLDTNSAGLLGYGLGRRAMELA
ncbi:MAG: hypothetical protein NTX51_14265, partial [Verrucomicrobia bacterium]|nr:hypothetical protein [Verrucomicrobiota bacterium]